MISQVDQDRKALEEFAVGNEDLERLEALLDRFNIFEAIGIVKREVRHSDFLAFLLDPRQNHGLGDSFAKQMLQRILMTADDVPVSVTPIELELWDLDRMEVRREWQYIDILLLDGEREHKLAVVIENKIYSGEHSNQLQRHLDVIENHFPGWRKIPLYLSPDGDTPSHEDYLPVSYGQVCDVIDELVESRTSVMNEDVKTLMTHYTEMLRRNIVGDSEIAELCRQIYRKHKRAIDLIYEHRPDIQTSLKDELETLVDTEPNLILDHSTKSRIRFTIEGWDRPALLKGRGWTASDRILLFEFWNGLDNLQLKLMVGPGEEETRQNLFEMVRANPDHLQSPRSTHQKHGSIYSRPFLDKRMYVEGVSDEERTSEIRRCWAEFLVADLPQIKAALSEQTWIWESVEGD